MTLSLAYLSVEDFRDKSEPFNWDIDFSARLQRLEIN
jgi:hypothetical protein